MPAHIPTVPVIPLMAARFTAQLYTKPLAKALRMLWPCFAKREQTPRFVTGLTAKLRCRSHAGEVIQRPFVFLRIVKHHNPAANHALQRTRRWCRGCNRCVPCAGSL